ncbi:TonB-dependent receptor domain-containing protein [Francisella sp. SYW-9]|uniref:TonB-dependent receptor domain-containing protein n=1 Tax=Francisella sp. SYW-9 TaxID=2610888 RepID=UPI00123CAB2D|nr:TonB-dependent receptor [Francisella sp. SYW-9]
MKKNILVKIMLSLFMFSCAYSQQTQQANNGDTVDLGEIEVAAVKKADVGNIKKDKKKKESVEQSANAAPPLSTSNSKNSLILSTADQLNKLQGVQIFSGSREISQNISMGGLAFNRVFVGIDGINNNFASFGHNSTRQLPSESLYKQVSADQSGSNIVYGNGALGGAVNFETIDPSDLLKGRAFATKLGVGGETGDLGVNGNTAVAFKVGDFSYLFDIVGGRNNDIRLGNHTNLPYSASNNLQFLLKGVWNISKIQTFKAYWLSMQNNGLYPATINDVVGEYNPPSKFNFLQQQVMLEYYLNPNNPYVNLAAKVFYIRNNYNSNPINDGQGFAVPQNIKINTTGFRITNKTFVLKQNLVYGTEFKFFNGFNVGKNSLNFPTANQQTYSGYLQDSWDITSKLNITLGGRVNGYHSQSGKLQNGGAFFTKQGSISYKIIKPLKVYFAYTEGYRIPSLQDLFLGGSHPGMSFLQFVPNANLKPEIGHNKSVGITVNKQLTPTQSFYFNSNIFLNDVSNFIVDSKVNAASYPIEIQNINISHAQLLGYSLAFKYHNSWFDFGTNFTYTRGESLSAYQGSGGSLVPSGSPLPIPRAKGIATLDIPIKPIDSSFQTSINYALTQNRVPPGGENPISNVPGYVLLNLGYKWQPKRFKGLNVSAGVNNVFNRYYQNYDGQNLVPAMGRNFYLQASYNF